MELTTVFGIIERAWPFTPRQYRDLRGLPANSAKAFGFKLVHVLLHMQKSIGEISATLEEADHRHNQIYVEMRETVKTLIVDAIRMGQLVGLTPEEFAAHINDAVKSRASEVATYVDFDRGSGK